MKTNWQTKKLGEICEIVMDKPGRFNGTKKYYTTRGINNNGNYKYELVDYATRPGRADLMPKVGDVGFAKMKNTNKVFIITEDLEGGIFSTGFCFLRVKENILSRFLFIFIASDEFQKIKDDLASEGIMGGIKKSDIGQIELGLPSIVEQQHIVKTLDRIFNNAASEKENVEKNLRNVKELFESYLQSVFANPGKNWEKKILKEIGKTQTGLTPKTANKKYYGNFISFITPADVDILGDGSIRYDSKGLSGEGLKVGRKIDANSVLMVCIGATIGKVGFSKKDVSCNQQINTLTPKSAHEPKFFYYALRTNNFYNKVIKSSSQATLPIINKSKWENLSAAFPKFLSEQKNIVKKLDALSVETKKLEAIYKQKLMDLEELRKAVLKKVLTGELSLQGSQVVEAKSIIVPSPYVRNQVHAAIIEQVLGDGGWTTEVAVAKYDHLLQEVYGLSLGYRFQAQQFGPFDAQIKRLVCSGLGRNKWFVKRNGMIVLGGNVNALLLRQSNLYHAAQFAMKELAKLGITRLNAEKVELLSTICHSIKETKSTALDKVKDFMSQWPTDGNRTKADKFSSEQIQKCLDFIMKNNLHLRLLKTL